MGQLSSPYVSVSVFDNLRTRVCRLGRKIKQEILYIYDRTLRLFGCVHPGHFSDGRAVQSTVATFQFSCHRTLFLLSEAVTVLCRTFHLYAYVDFFKFVGHT